MQNKVGGQWRTGGDSARSTRSPLLITSRQVDGTGPLADCAPSSRCLRSSCSWTRPAGAYIGVRMKAPPLSLPLQLEPVAPAVGAVQCVAGERTLVAAARFRHHRWQHPFAAARRFFVKSTAPARSRIARLRCVASVGAARGPVPLEHHWRAHGGAAISLPLQLEPVAPAVGAVQCAAVERTLVAAPLEENAASSPLRAELSSRQLFDRSWSTRASCRCTAGAAASSEEDAVHCTSLAFIVVPDSPASSPPWEL